jgi:arginyl-tRNA synthetase
VYHLLEEHFRQALTAAIRDRYGLELSAAVERPPQPELGELASPVAFELARRLRRPPQAIAAELAAALPPVDGIERVETAGPYLNARFDRARFLALALAGAGEAEPGPAARGEKTIVEHTSINPNKAAHIGHLRNAVLGDTLVRLLRHAGHVVQVQNYIDDTGVQVADVVLGFLHLERRSPAEVRALTHQTRFDYYCWDLYARVTEFLEQNPEAAALRQKTLQAIEQGHSPEAEMAEVVSMAVLRRHLETMARLGIHYDLLARESDILRLHFWEAAFRMLVERGVITRPASGTYAGCWIMTLGPGNPEAADETEAKVIVRSNGTVTYVGKDIAYQLWKFGLLGLDFRYRRFENPPGGQPLWITCSDDGEPDAPAFGHASAVYNVIDSRQSYLQRVVAQALEALGYPEQARRSIHFSYEMVALSPRCAAELGYELSPEEARRPYVEVSGRRGLGVKADDLLDRMEAAALEEVRQRHPDRPEEQCRRTAHAVAVGALRYFLLKFTRNAVIAFDFRDALSFEGETGPYVQYAVVRARNIFRKLSEQEPGFPLDRIAEQLHQQRAAAWLAGPDGQALWALVLQAGSLGSAVRSALAADEPAILARYSFELAQAFNAFYHRHHILSETDPDRKAFLLAITTLVERQLTAALALLGIESPDWM